MAKLTVRDLDVRGKRVFMRVDYNVPMEEKDGQMVINDATRIVETLPTLKFLVAKGAKVILAAHLGRPKGKREATMSLAPVAVKLSELLGQPVKFVDDCIGEKVESAVAAMKDGDVTLLENVRYYNEEEANDPAFAAEEKAKKLKVNFQLPTDTIIATPVDSGKLNKKGRPVYDLTNIRTVSGDIPDDAEGFSIGPETAANYAKIISSAKTVLWNGPMGMFEDARFAAGTNAVAQAVVDATQQNGAKSIIGGGDSVKAVDEAGLGDKVTFMSTGGRARLGILEGAVLPGVAALSEK